MSWIKKSLSCFHYDKHSRCECDKKIGSKSYNGGDVKPEVSHKNIQCNFGEDFSEEDVGHLMCDKGQ